MQLIVTFMTWLLGDGDYDSMRTGQLVNLAFQFHPDQLSEDESDRDRFELIGDYTYEFIGAVLGMYDHGSFGYIAVEAAGMRFYILVPHELRQQTPFDAIEWAAGQRVSGIGSLGVDPFDWSEYVLRNHEDAPDIFHTSRVTQLRYVSIPDDIWQTRSNELMGALWAARDLTQMDVKVVESMVPEPTPEWLAEWLALSESERAARSKQRNDAYMQNPPPPGEFLIDLDDRDLPDEPVEKTILF